MHSDQQCPDCHTVMEMVAIAFQRRIHSDGGNGTIIFSLTAGQA